MNQIIVHCPICGDQVSVTVKVEAVRKFYDGVRSSLLVDFKRGDELHFCLDPTKDKTP